jgi:hypothetical protein
MENNYIESIEPTPKLHSKKCRLISFVIRIFLQFGVFLFALIAWYFYDYFIAISTMLVSYIVIGIVRSKLRNSAIPFTQREYQYNDEGIANWYTSKEICDDSLEYKLQKIK